jgi:hypothetical protein
MNSASSSQNTRTVASRVKAALAICVAGEIFAQTSRRPDSAAKELRVRIAADALDKTKPNPYIFERYGSKAPGQTDAQFLLENLDEIVVLQYWPPRKVAPHEWGEYSRAMRGMEIFLKKAYSGEVFSRAERADVAGTLCFIAPQVKYLKDSVVTDLLQNESYLAPCSHDAA